MVDENQSPVNSDKKEQALEIANPSIETLSGLFSELTKKTSAIGKGVDDAFKVQFEDIIQLRNFINQTMSQYKCSDVK